ncbi:MAG: Fur family transcriptional regulator [Chloroflexota bacterium]|nr:Fur family transcriptional regulator [Chloroflexota bacterium]
MTTLAERPRLDDMLEDLGYRMTPSRRLLARLLGSKAGSFSAEAISEELPTVGRATVYRTLKLLVDAGVLCKTALPDGAPRYSFDDARHHHHVICADCGKVEEFRKPVVERLLREMAKEVRGAVVGHRVELYITCAKCLSER